MIILHDFGISLEEYAINGKKNKFPTFDKCPNCNCVASGNLHRHGYYWRNTIAEEKEAIKYMKMIRDFGESLFLRRSWGHFSSYFMAN